MASTRPRGAPSTTSISSSLLSLDTICSGLKISPTDVIQAYLLGSRLWGTSNSQSDYDVYLILRDKCPSASALLSSKGFASVHSGNIDALLIREEVYKDRLLESAVFDLITLWIPAEYTIKTTLSYPWKENLEAIEASVEKVLQRDIDMAQKHFEGGKPAKSKKVLVHTLRMILMATQIVESGLVSDWQCASDIFETLMNSYHLTTWESLEEEFLAQKESEMAKFKAALEAKRNAKRSR